MNSAAGCWTMLFLIDLPRPQFCLPLSGAIKRCLRWDWCEDSLGSQGWYTQFSEERLHSSRGQLGWEVACMSQPF